MSTSTTRASTLDVKANGYVLRLSARFGRGFVGYVNDFFFCRVYRHVIYFYLGYRTLSYINFFFRRLVVVVSGLVSFERRFLLVPLSVRRQFLVENVYRHAGRPTCPMGVVHEGFYYHVYRVFQDFLRLYVGQRRNVGNVKAVHGPFRCVNVLSVLQTSVCRAGGVVTVSASKAVRTTLPQVSVHSV